MLAVQHPQMQEGRRQRRTGLPSAAPASRSPPAGAALGTRPE